MAEAMPITPAVVTWARERAGFSVDAATSDFRKIVEWEAGDAFPSYPQLERMAEKFKVPVAVFFFPAPPDLPPIEETFRTLGPDQIAEIPPRIRLLLRKARTFQMGVEELNGGRNPAERLITRDLAFRPTDRIEEIAAEVRAYLGVTMEQQFAWGNAETALEEWRKVLLGVGVNVFKDSFREPDYSGFCLYDDEFPIIYVNNTTAKTRQIFTLFHELAHLLFHTSGVDRTGDGFVDELVGDDHRIEVICNRMAACLLVPEDTFDTAFAGQMPTEATAIELAQLFSVSREFIFRKFLDRDLITPGEYDQAARRWAEQGQRGTGGDHYNTKIAYLGTEYINLAFQRFYQNRIDYNQLADILDTKPKNLTRLEEYVSRRAP
ncbi:ImmA/IrrE family metallo-endopeptidase [uncultured Tateyamaria sp.]|uniref:ImmA/IrrE family metallo-endopeptidase n=1 Tax=uncultured Tateyamaria sp. TaxID=455651 RepID=UPI00260B0A24|nr:ImmA/IrrE family metallo-endopeptidase [uncultured Tateyamaria sp.]